MSSIRINTAVLRSASSSLKSSMGRLDRTAESLRAANGAAAPIGRVSGGLRGEFSQATALVDDLSRNMRDLTAALDAIASSYEKTEAALAKRMRFSSAVSSLHGGVSPSAVAVVPAALIGGGVLAGGRAAKGGSSKSGGKASGYAKLTGPDGKASWSSGAKWDKTKGNVYANIKGKAEGWLAKGEVSGDYGLLHGDASAKVGDASIAGEARATWMKDGKIDPSLAASAKVEGTLLHGEGNARIGTDDLNAYGKAEGNLGTASAEAKVQLDKSGFSAGAKAEAYAATGKVEGGLDLGFVKIGAGVEGKAGGLGVGVGAEATATSAKGEIGAGLGLGASVYFSIDWSGLSKLWK